MTRVLVTGGRGVLGRELVPRLLGAGYRVRVMSRGPRPRSTAGPAWPRPFPSAGPSRDSAQTGPSVEWAQADVATDVGVAAAVDDVQDVVHAASSPFRGTRAVDVDGTRRMLEAARAAGVRHLVYVSIVGIDRVPYAYYRHKLAAEALVEAGNVPFSILRATQFHALLARVLEAPGPLPARAVPAGFRFQPVDEGEVAARLVAVVAGGPSGRLPDFGGPAVLPVEELAHAWATARGRRVILLPLPLPGAAAAAFRAGLHTCPDQALGRVTWEEYLRRAGDRPRRNASRGGR